VRLPDDLYTDDEMARCHELLDLLRAVRDAQPEQMIPREEREP
jgi:hypothetical protein